MFSTTRITVTYDKRVLGLKLYSVKQYIVLGLQVLSGKCRTVENRMSKFGRGSS